jgi:prepilin-type N-terminal cleavage/methylation domain-containing protein
MFSRRSRDEIVVGFRDNRPARVKVPCALQSCQQGFTVVELIIVIAILLVLAGMTAPKLVGMIETERLQTATRAYASFIQQSRYRAEEDGQWYEILLDTSNPSTTIAYLDINGNNARDTNEPSVEIPAPITIPSASSSSIPGGFANANLIGAEPLPMISTAPATWNCLHAQNCGSPVQTAGLAFNERGLPCQITAANATAAATAACTNTAVAVAGTPPVTAPVAWITYFASPTSSGGNLYAAVTVTPAGRIKVWNYQGTTTGGSWQ